MPTDRAVDIVFAAVNDEEAADGADGDGSAGATASKETVLLDDLIAQRNRGVARVALRGGRVEVDVAALLKLLDEHFALELGGR